MALSLEVAYPHHYRQILDMPDSNGGIVISNVDVILLVDKESI